MQLILIVGAPLGHSLGPHVVLSYLLRVQLVATQVLHVDYVLLLLVIDGRVMVLKQLLVVLLLVLKHVIVLLKCYVLQIYLG